MRCEWLCPKSRIGDVSLLVGMVGAALGDHQPGWMTPRPGRTWNCRYARGGHDESPGRPEVLARRPSRTRWRGYRHPAIARSVPRTRVAERQPG